MEQLKVLFNNWNYYFQILNYKLTSNNVEIQILLNGVTRTLVKKENGSWTLKQGNNLLQNELIESIGKTLSKQFRF